MKCPTCGDYIFGPGLPKRCGMCGAWLGGDGPAIITRDYQRGDGSSLIPEQTGLPGNRGDARLFAALDSDLIDDDGISPDLTDTPNKRKD